MNKSKFEIIRLFSIGNSIQKFNKRSEKDFGISAVQWCLLKKLVDMPAISAQRLARIVGIHPSTLTQTLKRLEKKGFVFITEDQLDSRKKCLSITRKGNEILNRIEVEMLRKCEEFQKISKELDCVEAFLANSTNSGAHERAI